MAGNPFFIDPSAGYNPSAVAGLSNVLQNIGSQRQAREREDRAVARESSRITEGVKKKAAMDAEIQEAIKSNDPTMMADIAIKYPEMKDAISNAVGFASKETEGIYKSAYRQSLADPENAPKYLESAIESIAAKGGNPKNLIEDLEMARESPEEYIDSIRMSYAAIDPEGSKAFDASVARKDKIAGRESDEDHREQVRVDTKNYRNNQLLIQQENARISRLSNSLKGQGNDLKRQELEGKIKERQLKIEKAERENSQADQAESEGLVLDIRGVSSFKEDIEKLLNDPQAIASLTGALGPVINFPGSSGWDAVALFDQITNTQTLESMSLMSGVLTDKDMEVLRSASNGLKRGMSENAFKARLTKILNKVNTSLAVAQKKADEWGVDYSPVTEEVVYEPKDNSRRNRRITARPPTTAKWGQP